MSRSRKKAPVIRPNSAGSMKWWRRSVNKRHRHNNKQLINKMLVEERLDELTLRLFREDGNIYDSPIDGFGGWQLKPSGEEKEWWTIDEWKKIFRK